EVERVVPEPRLEVALHLRQVEVRALALVELALGTVEEVEPEVEQGARHGLAVDEEVLLVQVPAARPDDDGRELAVLLERVRLAGLGVGEVDGAVEGVPQVELPLDHVVPQRRVGVLEVGQPHLGARVERVDGHLPVGRAGDLDAAVDQAGSGLGDPPGVVLPDGPGLGEEVERLALGEPALTLGPRLEELLAARAELALEGGEQAERLGGQDLLVPLAEGSGDLDAFQSSHRAALSSSEILVLLCGDGTWRRRARSKRAGGRGAPAGARPAGWAAG